MSTDTLRVVIGGALLLHGLGHGGALGALVWIGLRPGDDTGAWHAARSWLLPALPAATATAVASTLWILAMIGFVAAALSFWGALVPGELWRQLAVASSIVSLIGIALFLGTWPAFNTIAAVAVNVAVLVSQLWLHTPPQAVFGK